jgi:hypothetical protein
MSNKNQSGFWNNLTALERDQIKYLVKALFIVLSFTIIASLVMAGIVSIFGL